MRVHSLATQSHVGYMSFTVFPDTSYLNGTVRDRTHLLPSGRHIIPRCRLPEHPNVVACYAMDDTVSTMPLAYEFCDSGDLTGVVDGKIELTIAEKLE